MKYQVMPDLTPIEYEALKADIQERGVLVPVEIDEAGAILDGHHRVRAWSELRSEGVNLPDYPRMIRSGLTEEQKRNHARSLNVLRRHLSRDQRDEVMRAMRADGMSYRQIAKAVGVVPMTAYYKTTGVQIYTPVNGSDGKQYPAQQARRTDPPAIVPGLFVSGDAVDTQLDGATVASYIQHEHVRECPDCHQVWAADLPYCPYCNITPQARIAYVQQERTLHLAAANHAVSSDPNYDGDEWYTPTEYIEAARAVMGSIDLDPASCHEAQKVIRAGHFYTKQDDGLTMPWFGRVWLNPPYSTPLIRQFVTKLIDEYDNGNVAEALILTNNSSDTAWFHDLLARFPACFTRGRVQFWRADHETFGARQGQTLFYLGQNDTTFRDTFSTFGQVVTQL